MEQERQSGSDRRLESWKEIAAFFGRDERTVRRWERDSALPVHRVPGGTKGRVFAYEGELRQWLSQPPSQLDSAPPADDDSPSPSSSAALTGAVVSPGRSFLPKGKWLVAAILCLVVAGFVVYRSGHRLSVHASPASSLGNRDPRQPANPEAQEFYLQGRYYWTRRTPEDLNKAVDLFTQSIVHDPGYAPAYVGLADSYNLLREYSAMPASEAYPRALAAAKKAVELDDQSAEGHASLAFVAFFGMWDFESGEREFRRAIALDPNNPKPHQWWANALLALHRLPEAVGQIESAQALDPSSSSILADKGNILMVAGRQQEGIALLKAMAVRDPSFRSPHRYLRDYYFRVRDYPNYLAELRQDALTAHDDSALAIADAARQGYAAGGERGLFKAMLQAQQELYEQQRLSPTDVARTHTALGNNSEALRYLNLAFDQRDGGLLFIEDLSEFEPLYKEPAYGDLLKRMKLPPQTSQGMVSASSAVSDNSLYYHH